MTAIREQHPEPFLDKVQELITQKLSSWFGQIQETIKMEDANNEKAQEADPKSMN